MVTTPINATSGLFLQTLWSKPAFTVGAGVIFKIIKSETGVQLPVEVNVIVTTPDAISAGLGTYSAFKSRSFGKN